MSYVYVKKSCREKLCFLRENKGRGKAQEFGKNLILLAVLYIGTDLVIVLFFQLNLTSLLELSY